MTDSRKRILITGASGLVGTKLVEQATRIEAEVVLTSRNPIDRTGFPHRCFDLSDTENIPAFLSELRPDIIIHTAAVTSVDHAAQHPEETDSVNVRAVEKIASWCAESNCRLVHFSTDFVFDGERGMYNEEDQPAPLSYYGQSKWKSEQVVQERLNDHVIIRTVLVYGYAPALPRLNFPLWIASRLEQEEETRITADQFRTPTLAEDLAKATLDLALSDHRGTYHISGPEYMSVYDFAVKAANAFGLNAGLLVPVTTASMNQQGQRPLKTGFDIQKAADDIDFAPVSVEEGLAILLRQRTQKTDLYI